MTVSEKAAFLKGLIEGSDLKFGEKEQKVVDALIDLICDMAQTVTNTAKDVDELYETVEDVYDELDAVEEDLDELFGDEDIGDDEQQLYDVECQNCHEIICIDEETLMKGELECPNCGEKLEFGLDICGGNCGGCSGCGGNDEE